MLAKQTVQTKELLHNDTSRQPSYLLFFIQRYWKVLLPFLSFYRLEEQEVHFVLLLMDCGQKHTAAVFHLTACFKAP